MAAALAAHWRIALIVLITTLVWCAHYDRWTWASWQFPTDFTGDAHETLARLKAAAEGDVWPLRPQVIERLGAPFGAHWNAYPTPDKPLMVFLGGMVNLIGLYPAANLGLLLAQISAVLAFYLAARWLRCRWEWAAAGALLFAYTYHTFHRGLAHFSLVFTWTVPLGLLVVWVVARSRRIEANRRETFFCVAVAVALGVSNPYNLFFWLQLMGLAVVLQLLGRRRWPNVRVGLLAIAVSAVAFVVVHAEGWLYADDTEALPLLVRNYGGTERYALKAMEMFIPPTFHHWGWLAFFGNRYARWSEWRGEVFLPYLGLAGIAGLIWLVSTTVRRVARRQSVPAPALAVGWLLTYASIGGVTNLLALFAEFQSFRATNRAAIFISAIVLFFLASRMSRLTVRWPAGLRVAVALLVVGIGVYEQLPLPESRADQAAWANLVRIDRDFGRKLEDALPPRSMIFQMPVLGFPEVTPPNRLSDYEHFRPYLATRTLRFSYGAPKTRARSRWQVELANQPLETVVERLEAAGFSALYLNRKGYQDGASAILRELELLGYARRIVSSGGDQIVVPLRPAPQPRPPMGQSFTFGRGWHVRVQDGVRWAYDRAAMSYFNPHPAPITVELKLTLVGVTPREVTLEQEGKRLAGTPVTPHGSILSVPRLELAPGVNRFTLRSDKAAVRLGAGQNQLRSFGVQGMRVRTVETPGPVARSK